MHACLVAQSCWTLFDHCATLSMGFSKQEYWNGLSFPLPRDLPDPGMEPVSLASPALQMDCLSTEPPGSFKWRVSNVSSASSQHGGSVTRMNFPREEVEWKPRHFHDLTSEVVQHHFCYVLFIRAQPYPKTRGIR